MKHTSLGNNHTKHLLYIEKGERVNEQIEQFCIAQNIVHASYTGIGAICKIDLAQYNLSAKDYSHRFFEEVHELSSLIGNLSFVKNENENDRWFAHTHITISNAHAEGFGGHLFEATVAAVTEIYLTAYTVPLYRSFDAETGLNTMDSKCFLS